MKQFFIAASSLLLPGLVTAQLVLDNTLTVTQCVNDILLGEGVTASNVTFNGQNGNQVTVQVGAFDGQNANVGFASGLIMASGGITVVNGPNNSGGNTVDSGSGNTNSSDPDFAAINPGYTANDWCVIEFDFVAVGDSISFRYVWGSEEYMEWVNSSFNDVFAFFLSGPGIDGPYSNDAINIALVPGTSLPVTIDNVNLNNNGQYYVDNGDGFTEPQYSDPYYINFDGFTVPLVASSAVQCGQTYHIKLACADSGDSILDCGVFLEEGSFSSNALNIEGEVIDPPAFLPSGTVLEGCVNGFFTIFQPNEAVADTLPLTITGTAAPGEDYETFPATVIIPQGEISIQIPFIPNYDPETEGTESVTVSYTYINSCGDPDTAVATMYIMDYVDMVLEFDELFICPGEELEVSAEPQGGAPNYSYEWSTGGNGEEESFEQGDAGNYNVTVTDYCEHTVTSELTVTEPDPFSVSDYVEMCLGATASDFATGGAMPYEYTYNDSAFNMSGPEDFTSLWEGEYTIGVTDQCGQFEALELLVEVCNTLIPNIFTPNDDGDNDFFVIDGIDGYPKSAITIFNRWGSKIFEHDNYRNTWNGEDYPDGVYYYIFERSDGNNYEGYVHLVRGGK